jgi:hypothetical protein
MTDWLQEELNALENSEKIAKTTWLKFEENRIKDLIIDFSQKWEKKSDKFDKLQALIPIKEGNELKTWGLNTANPFYRVLLKEGAKGKTIFKILQTGKGQDTRFAILE